jgi:hypothetical protein
MKQFRYEVRDQMGIVRCHDSKWDAYNHAKSDSTLWVKINPQVKVNRFIESFKQLGDALI